MRKSGPILWCGVCGSFAETRASGLAGSCKGLPSQQHGAGRSSLNRLNSLRAGLHPVTFTRLPEATKLNGEALRGDGIYARLKQTNSEVVPDSFVRYVPELFIPQPQLDGRTAADKRRQRLGRIRLKEASEVRRMRKLRMAEATFEARMLYESFVGCGKDAAEEVINPNSREHADDDSDEEFWNGLSEIDPPALRTGGPVKEPWECMQRMARPSRMQRLTASRPSRNELLLS